MPNISRKLPESRGQAWEGFSLTVLRRNQPRSPTNLRLLTSGTVCDHPFVLFKPPSLWCFVIEALGNEWYTYTLILKRNILKNAYYLGKLDMVEITNMWIVYWERSPRIKHRELAKKREKSNLGQRPRTKRILGRKGLGGFYDNLSAEWHSMK